MRRRDVKAIELYTRRIADKMGLRDWEFNIVVTGDPGGPDGHKWGACCSPFTGRKLAVIALHPERRDDDLGEFRDTIVHELTHCHLFAMWESCIDDLDGLLDDGAYEVWAAGVRRSMEYGVDAIAKALAPHMPLIRWPNQ